MGRMLWVAVGAAGGVVAYRKGQHVLAEARRRGVVGSMQAATGSAAGLAQNTRVLVERILSPRIDPVSSTTAIVRPSGTAAARALAEARRSKATPAGEDTHRTVERTI